MGEEVIFRLEGYDGDHFCLKGWPLNYGENGAGGMDIEAVLTLKMSYFQLNDAPVVLSTDLLKTWLQDLRVAYLTLKGQSHYKSYYDDLICQIKMTKGGQLLIQGIYREYHGDFSSLQFEMASDQTFLAKAIKDLETFLSRVVE